ncbi:MAG: hypothetical protein KF708_04675 [Pirellulales bacterium]|nr:hypothetical protein [Pirellulales bacterium]
MQIDPRRTLMEINTVNKKAAQERGCRSNGRGAVRREDRDGQLLDTLRSVALGRQAGLLTLVIAAAAFERRGINIARVAAMAAAFLRGATGRFLTAAAAVGAVARFTIAGGLTTHGLQAGYAPQRDATHDDRRGHNSPEIHAFRWHTHPALTTAWETGTGAFATVPSAHAFFKPAAAKSSFLVPTLRDSRPMVGPPDADLAAALSSTHGDGLEPGSGYRSSFGSVLGSRLACHRSWL